MSATKTIGVLFPGQGSQSVGMLGHLLAQQSAAIGDLIERADAALGYSISGIISNGPLDVLTRTEHAQPAILLASLCHWRWMTETRTRPGTNVKFIMAGHSLGEYSALVAGGYLSFEDGLRLTALRGRIMSECSVTEKKPGMMLVVSARDVRAMEEGRRRLEAWLDPQESSISALNSPIQLVLAGSISHLESVAQRIKEQCPKMRVARLRNVSCAFHSPLMRSAQERFRREARGLFDDARVATTPFGRGCSVLSNVTAEPVDIFSVADG